MKSQNRFILKTAKFYLSALGFICLAVTGCTNESQNNQKEISSATDQSASTLINFAVVTTYPHDTSAFTEGLVVHNGKLYESTGSPEDLGHTKSLVGVSNLSTGKLEKRIELDRKQYFGEGIAFLKDKLYQLTYQTKIGFVYDAGNFQQVGTFALPTAEGWGLTTDGTSLIMSDGTHQLTFLEAGSFKVMKVVTVQDQQGAVLKLNELEYIRGYVYANVYTTPYIIKIDPQSGRVAGKLDLSSLAHDAKTQNPRALEMNGIAFDSTSNSIYVTGKFWPNIYQIAFTH